MKKEIGIIGIGSMGSMLLQKIMEFNLFDEKNIYITNRSKEKLENLKNKYPQINICQNNIDMAKNCNNILICVEPLNLPDVLTEIQPFLNKEKYLMISTSMITLKDIYKFHKGGTTIFMPTLISMVNEGITLACHNDHINSNEKMFFESMMGNFSEVKILQEEDINLTQNFTGSFPGFFAEITLEFVKAATKISNNVSEEELEHILLKSIHGASKLLLEKNMGLEETINRVSTKGGVTFEGVKVFEEKLPEVFDAVLKASTGRYDEITQMVNKKIDSSGCASE